MTDIETNFPFWAYPRFPCAGYLDVEEYNKELKKLIDYVKKLKTRFNEGKKVLVHITIGAAMEEYKVDCNEDIGIQWQQLFPIHLQNIVNHDYDTKIYHIIISPNKSFSQKRFITPSFIENTSEHEWNMTDDRLYTNKENSIEVAIFYTPMPSIDDRNKKIIDRIVKTDIDHVVPVELYMQTDNDIKFVNNFYHELNIMMNELQVVNGICTCFSFAVFNSQTDKGGVNNYTMFEMIKKLFEGNYSVTNRILAEWLYTPTCHVMLPYKGCCSEPLMISYVDFDKKDSTLIKYISIVDDKLELSSIKSTKKYVSLDMRKSLSEKDTTIRYISDEDKVPEIESKKASTSIHFIGYSLILCIDNKAHEFSIMETKTIYNSLMESVCFHLKKDQIKMLEGKFKKYLDNMSDNKILKYLMDKKSYSRLYTGNRTSTDIIKLYKYIRTSSDSVISDLQNRYNISNMDVAYGELEISIIANILDIIIIKIGDNSIERYYPTKNKCDITKLQTVYVLYDKHTTNYNILDYTFK
jgi:hypothetical protein